ncbi:MAG: phosphopeptide-binding protein [Alkalinema sp. CACIAM 70d]|nr:MAG: phosphopeptide-binding protein [Alkalinema sp. CACIAM 70d]
MISCPNCNHQNPAGAVQCESCFTPLPALSACPNCGASIQSDASFCGQCGFNLQTIATASSSAGSVPPPPPLDPEALSAAFPDLIPPDPIIIPDPIVAVPPPPIPAATSPAPSAPEPAPAAPAPSANTPAANPPVEVRPTLNLSQGRVPEGHTQLQMQTAKLLHVQTNVVIELPQSVPVVHIGKPNDRIPPDIDVSGFPNSEIVSRIHADIRVEGDVYFVEDVGSSNGTYVNNSPLPVGSRYRLRPGDRISLGKGDKVTFLFQLA